METMCETFRLAPVLKIFAGQFDGGLVGLGTGIAEKDAVRKTQFHQHPGQFGLGNGIIQVGHMHQLSGLAGHCIGDARMGMAQVANGDAGDKVRIAAPLGIPDRAALYPFQNNGKPFVCRAITWSAVCMMVSVIYLSGSGFVLGSGFWVRVLGFNTVGS
jgi:hypothetical protein